MKLSVVIPARNEAGSIAESVRQFAQRLEQESIPHEILVVDDGSADETLEIVQQLSSERPQVRAISNRGAHGFGRAVRRGLEAVSGDAVAIVMADASDSPDDLVVYYRKLQEGYDCVFGSRFVRGGKIIDYPPHKLLINRLANNFIRILFGIRLNDTTNAFKCYRMHVVRGLQPLISEHFNLTVEMPLKAIIRGYSYAIVPISWRNRRSGVSKLKLQEMGSRYLFITLYAWLERSLSRGDYHRSRLEAEGNALRLNAGVEAAGERRHA